MTSKQSQQNEKKNQDFFLNHLTEYKDMVGELDTYQNIFRKLNKEVAGIKSLIDIGNGGVFAYEPSLVESITAVDLFLESLDQSKYPKNVVLKQGNALKLDEPEESYDAVLLVMLIHHLVGSNLKDTEQNLSQCIGECFRVLKPGGRLIIVESCVPNWLYRAERLFFKPANYLISKFLTHPMAFQYTRHRVESTIKNKFGNCTTEGIPKGKYVIQLGWKVPSKMTPVEPYLFTAVKN